MEKQKQYSLTAVSWTPRALVRLRNSVLLIFLRYAWV